MPLRQPPAPWRVSQVMELAGDLAERSVPWAESAAPISDPALFRLWSETRRLTAEWDRRYDEACRWDWHLAPATAAVRWDLIATEIFAVESVLRVLGTCLAAVDLQAGHNLYRPIADRVVLSVQHVRRRLLTGISQAGDDQSALDRFRRRCERWTDMLIGPCLVRFGTATFTHDGRRAWEFGEDLLANVQLDALSSIVRPAMQSAFSGNLGDLTVHSPPWSAVADAIFALLPSSQPSSALNFEPLHQAVDPAAAVIPPSTVASITRRHEMSSTSLLEHCLRLIQSRRTSGS